jgi:hypothetical protein
MLRLMLDAHPQLAIPHETGFITGLDGLDAEDAGLREALHAHITGFPSWPDLATPAEELDRAFAEIEEFDLRAGLRAFYRLYAERRGKPRWGDKTPIYLQLMDRIHALLPEARFVHLIRDGRDVAVSIREEPFAPAKHIPTLAAYWRDEVSGGRKLGASVPYMEIRYENLVERPEPELRRICELVEMPYDAAMLEYHRTARGRLDELAAFTAAERGFDRAKDERLRAHRFTSNPPRGDRIGRWRDELTEDEARSFESVAGDLLGELGYELAS